MNRSLTDVYRGIHAFLTRLFAGRAPRIGLEVSDQAVRILFERKGAWQLEQVALAPGTVVKGKVMNAPVLLEALSELRRRAAGGDTKRRIGVHVSLTSAPVYTQQVAIPQVSASELQAAVELNVQVSAPVALSELAWGWQPLPGQTPPAILAAWTSRDVVDELVALLAQANFLPASLEPKVLSLARLVRELFPNGKQSSYVLVNVDETGATMSVIDAGTVRFQYARTWDEIRGTATEISYAMLETLLRREVPQVAGFYAQRGGARLTEVLLASPTFAPELAKTLTELGFTVRPLQVGTSAFPLQGYGAFGAALRGGMFSATDQADLSLLGGQVLAWLRKELVARVAGFWTLVAPLAIALLLVTFGAAYAFVSRVHQSVLAGSSQGNPVLLAELNDRETQAKHFNEMVRSLAAIQESTRPRSPLLKRINAAALQSGVTLARITLTGDQAPGSVAGLAGGDNQLLSFKRALESDPSLSAVTLPIADLRTGPDGVTFTISFMVNLANAATTTVAR